MACQVDNMKCPFSDPLPVLHEWHQPGDLLIGGISSQIVIFFSRASFTQPPSKELGFDSEMVVTKSYQHALALAYAVTEINENPRILPNVTLGFHICDSYYDARMAYHSTLRLLFKSNKLKPNYQCHTQKNLIAVIGGMNSGISFCMADFLSLYKIPQLTFGSFTPERSDRTYFPSFYHMVPSEAHQYKGIIHLIKHFGWTWVGLLAVDDDSGDRFLKILEPLFSENGICSAFTERIPKQGYFLPIIEMMDIASKMYPSFLDRKARTIITYGESMTLMWLSTLVPLMYLEDAVDVSVGKLWITTAQIDFSVTGFITRTNFHIFQGAISFSIHSNKHLGFQTYLENRNPYLIEGDGFLQRFWECAFGCSFPSLAMPAEASEICTGNENLESLPGPIFEMHMTGHSYGTYNAIYAIAHSLHAMGASTSHQSPFFRDKRLANFQPWQIHPFLQTISFNNSAGETVSFNEKGELIARFDIVNLVIFPNNSFQRIKIGEMNTDALEGKEFSINEDVIVQHRIFNEGCPLSVCSDSCNPGYQKKKKEGLKFCCYDCVHCPEGMISYQKDMDDCSKCPEDHFPSKNQDRCIPKTTSFLSYGEPLGISLTLLSLSLSVITALMLGAFIKHKNTPIVKANNRDITYTLLISLLLSFLSPLLFLGKPGSLTCMLRQSSFGIIFSMAVSCVLAKTITVVLAFVVIKPGSSMRKWMRKRLAKSIIFFCTLIQALICMVWLGTSPPFPDMDMKSLISEIIVQCNEGSVISFHLVLGYMGFLSIITFAVAFRARKLPDAFNETKLITFSMLIFCSVWFSFLPAYLSTKGKYMAAVEIFSILASSAGLLSWIFVPKCYIIVLKPDLNNRETLKRRKN